MPENNLLNGEHQSGRRERVGLVEWFQFNQYAAVEKALADFRQLGITHIRTLFSLADWQRPESREWYDWLFSALKEFDVLPCLLLTPSSFAPASKSAPSSTTTNGLADFAAELISRYGTHFEHVELWNEPNNAAAYDFTRDNNWNTFCELTTNAAIRCRQLGKKMVLGGMRPVDPNWLQHLFQKGLAQHLDVIGIHGFPGTFEDSNWNWNEQIARIQQVLDAHQSAAKIWITDAGFSTWQRAERRQVKEFINVLASGADRVYWRCLQDKAPALNPGAEQPADERDCYFGIKDKDGAPKLLYTLLAKKGLERIEEYEWMTAPVIGTAHVHEKYTLITGGAGFVGVNLADRLLSEGKKVMVFDNLSRAGVENNLFWLKEKHPHSLQIMVADIRDKAAITRAVQNAEQVFHFAAQVAVTSSLVHPYHDFEVNALGTLNLLEAIRQSAHQPPVIFTSTNKVYGDLHDLGIVMNGTRYHPENKYYRMHGISEERTLDFHSPYGCTKGVADQYILDYARTFGLQTVVFRMSCIYGPHQFGTEDQGWVAHFLIQALKDKPITLYGDGKQVRDILFVEDLVNAFLLAQDNRKEISGHAFNMGGGVHNTVSLLELCDMIGTISGTKPEVRFEDWRPSDQKYYVSDFGKFSQVTGWQPRVNTLEGVTRLYEWLQENASVPTRKKASRKQKLPSAV